MTRKKWTGPAAIIVTIVIAIVISVGYAQFATRQIRQESESHLKEIYTQINKTFYTTITKNWRMLHGWRNHISEKAGTNPEECAEFIQTLRDDWHFTTFYFFSEDGEYMTALGDRGYLDLGENLERLVEDREDIVVDGTLPSAKQITVFAVPIQMGQYNGFQYTAIGISFNSEDMTEALSINAFDGQSDCYITYPDGRILFSSQSREDQPYNLLTYIREHGTLTDGEDAAGVARDWKEGTARSVIWEYEGTSYYLCYQPVNFSGWMLVSIAPAGVVNASMNSFTMVTLAVIGLLFLTIGICVVSFVMAGNRRRMREKNQEIESREMLFDLLTQNTEDIFILFTPEDFAAGYVSPNMERVLGIRPEEIRGDVRPLLFGMGEGSPEEGQSLLTPEILAGVSMGNLWAGEREITHIRTHEPRWFKQLLHHCSLQGKEQFIFMLSDRTKERKMNEALQEALQTVRAAKEAKEQEADYQTQLFNIFSTYLSRNTDDVYIMMDTASSRVEYISPNMERVFGVSKQRIMDGLLTYEVTTTTGEKMSLEKFGRLQPGEMTTDITIEWVNSTTGEHKWFLESAYGTRVQDRNKLVLYVSDRTKERKTHDSLTEALRMAQAANDAKSAFLSSISHDIRTPMNAIIGFLALMRDEVDNPGMVMEYNKRIDAASQHLLGLINDVLDMNKIESGSTTLNISEMNLAEVIDEINTIIRPQAKAKNQSFDIFVSHLASEQMLGDKLRINQILINLLSNAVKYTPENGSIQMRVDELPQVVDSYSRIRFVVSDSGLGMSADYLKVIFDPFTREETKATREIQGTGLGMAITKRLVDLMGGTIRVESEMDKGSTFTVELELRIQEQEDDPNFWIDHNVKRMIVTDDDEVTCRNIVKTMSKVGVAADYAADGETAVQMMRSAREAGRPYDLILLDWMMPDLNGLETARLIRKNYSNKVPILILTAYDWSEIEQEAMEIGVNHFMPKPFFMSTFKEAIRRIMGSLKKAESGRSDVVRGKHVLVVDDIEVNRIILVKILSTLGAVCDTAGNGQEAVERFEGSQPGEYDLIMMDVQMPVMDGYTATRTIRGGGHPSAKTVPIIAMTANAFVDDVRNAIESGMDAHIAKPVQIDNLKAVIQQVLDSRLEQTEEGLGRE